MVRSNTRGRGKSTGRKITASSQDAEATGMVNSQEAGEQPIANVNKARGFRTESHPRQDVTPKSPKVSAKRVNKVNSKAVFMEGDETVQMEIEGDEFPSQDESEQNADSAQDQVTTDSEVKAGQESRGTTPLQHFSEPEGSEGQDSKEQTRSRDRNRSHKHHHKHRENRHKHKRRYRLRGTSSSEYDSADSSTTSTSGSLSRTRSRGHSKSYRKHNRNQRGVAKYWRVGEEPSISCYG